MPELKYLHISLGAGQIWYRFSDAQRSELETTLYKFPGRGQRETPMLLPSKVLVLLMMLPGDNAKIFRARAAVVLGRVFAGDQTLKAEIDRYALTDTAMQALLRDELGVPPAQVQTRVEEPDERQERVKRMRIENNQMEVELLKSNIELLKEMGAYDDITKHLLATQMRNFALAPSFHSSSVSSTALITNVPENAPIEITTLARELGFCKALTHSQLIMIGSAMAKMYYAKHGRHAGKTSKYVNGGMRDVSQYYASDADMMERAIHQTLGC